MRKKSGISLASVMIVTFLIILLTTTITISVSRVSENAKKLSFASELNSLQTTIDSYYLANKEYPVLDESILLDISNVEDQEIFKEENIVNNKITLSKIDYDKIHYISLHYGTNLNEGDIYGVSLLTGKVYYASGMRFGNMIYYTLNEELKTLLASGRNSSIYENHMVIFTPSEIKWTNHEIQVDVKVPKKFTNISVISGVDSYSLSQEDENYDIYRVSKKGNYTVEVTYFDENGKQKHAIYDVKNFDDQKPVLEIDSHVTLNEEYNHETYGYYTIIKAEDNDSGVKEIKYEYGKIENHVNYYFKTNGNLVKDNRIIIKRGYEYITVYIEDNAGNYNIEYLKI
ncbi:MAG: hypothetical protein Q4D02_04870 [Clostridia bacterium]|nr:hypothetical protein [Clostridia bacterium]